MNDAAQRTRQAIPRGVERTTPLPPTVSDSRKRAGAKNASTDDGEVATNFHSLLSGGMEHSNGLCVIKSNDRGWSIITRQFE